MAAIDENAVDREHDENCNQSPAERAGRSRAHPSAEQSCDASVASANDAAEGDQTDEDQHRDDGEQHQGQRVRAIDVHELADLRLPPDPEDERSHQRHRGDDADDQPLDEWTARQQRRGER